MSKAEAVGLTSDEVEAILTAYNQEQIDNWSRTRWLATVLANFSGNAKKGGVKPTDLFKFEHEKKRTGIRDFIKAVKNG